MLDPDIRESPLSYGMKRSAPKRKHPRRSELPLNGGAGAAGFEPSPDRDLCDAAYLSGSSVSPGARAASWGVP